ncbi:hypothetical protein ACJO2E_14610 [Marinobacter sp. M1N3S26]|uniref:hypothetical protein n=1 Tax=unclassified Marinobacter TaxID=83889 RepID=UPI00387B6B8F
MRKQLLFVTMLLAIASCGSHANQTPAELNSEALEIMQAGADQGELQQVLELTSQAIEKDKDFLPARNTRVNALLQLGDMDRVVQEAEAIASINNTPGNQLYVCMAREVANAGYPGQQSCYSGVIDLMEENGRSADADANYLMAMKLANHPDFESHVWQYIEKQESESARQVAEYLFIESSREEVLHSYFSL